jgi:pimeloyl-ACP methyl ester carboxylesterase
MTTFVLIPGAGSGPEYWGPLAAELRARGHDPVPVDLPCEDDTAGLPEYADAAVAAIGDRPELVVVGHSFGGFTAPLVCERVSVDVLVMLQAMIPRPGEAPGDWWANTGHTAGDDDVVETYYHDVPPDLVDLGMGAVREQSAARMRDPWPLAAWPEVPTKFLLCRDDRFFTAEFMRRVVRERLGIVPEEIATGHCPMLARPSELADRLEAYARV